MKLPTLRIVRPHQTVIHRALVRPAGEAAMIADLRSQLRTLRAEHHLVLTWWNPDGTPHDSAPVHIHPGDSITIINKRRSGQDVTMRCEAQPGPRP